MWGGEGLAWRKKCRPGARCTPTSSSSAGQGVLNKTCMSSCWTSLGNKAALLCQRSAKCQLTSGPAAVVGANWPTLWYYPGILNPPCLAWIASYIVARQARTFHIHRWKFRKILKKNCWASYYWPKAEVINLQWICRPTAVQRGANEQGVCRLCEMHHLQQSHETRHPFFRHNSFITWLW